MAYDEFLAERMQRVYEERRFSFFAKKMFGGVCFMVDDKMCTGVLHKQMMVRVDPLFHEDALKKPGTRPMDESGMRGFIMIDPECVDMDEDLEYWMNLALEYNPKAKSSKKK